MRKCVRAFHLRGQTELVTCGSPNRLWKRKDFSVATVLFEED
jgi:hypothetical protein